MYDCTMALDTSLCTTLRTALHTIALCIMALRTGALRTGALHKALFNPLKLSQRYL